MKLIEVAREIATIRTEFFDEYGNLGPKQLNLGNLHDDAIGAETPKDSNTERAILAQARKWLDARKSLRDAKVVWRGEYDSHSGHPIIYVTGSKRALMNLVGPENWEDYVYTGKLDEAKNEFSDFTLNDFKFTAVFSETDMAANLRWWQVDVRGPSVVIYELCKQLSLSDQQKIGGDWREITAPIEDVDPPKDGLRLDKLHDDGASLPTPPNRMVEMTFYYDADDKGYWNNRLPREGDVIKNSKSVIKLFLEYLKQQQ